MEPEGAESTGSSEGSGSETACAAERGFVIAVSGRAWRSAAGRSTGSPPRAATPATVTTRTAQAPGLIVAAAMSGGGAATITISVTGRKTMIVISVALSIPFTTAG